MPHPALDALRELELRDAALGAALDTVVRLEHGAEEVGARAAVVDAFLLAAPDEHERLAAALAAAEVAVGEAERARNAADKAARDAEARQAREAAALRLEASLAADRLRGARDASARARVALERHGAEVEAAALEAPLLERQAAGLARELGRIVGLSKSAAGSPAAGLPGVVEWRSRARAGLLVVGGTLSRDRDALLREATETAAVVSPGLVAGPTVASVRAQLEAALG